MPKILSDIIIQTSQQETIDSKELRMLEGVKSPIQTQLDTKLDISKIGAINGVAPLNNSGIIPDQYITPFTNYINAQVTLSGFLSYNPSTKVFSTATTIPWASISSKPSTFTPTIHSHTISDIIGLSTNDTGQQITYNLLQSSTPFLEESDDFLGSSSLNKLGWSAAAHNGWSGAETANRFPLAFGVYTLGVYGASSASGNYSTLILGNKPMKPLSSEGYTNIELTGVVGLPGTTQTSYSYTCRFGLTDFSLGDSSTSILICAEYYENAYNWIALWKSSTSLSIQKQLITAVTGNLSTTLYTLKIKIDCETYKIYFTVDGITIEVNIGATNWLFQPTSPIFYIQRFVGGDANNKSFYVDKFILRKNISDTQTNLIEDIQGQLDNKIPITEKGVANGVTPLNADGIIPSTHLPTYTQKIGFGGSAVIYGVEPPVELSIPVPISQGGTGTTTAANALNTLGAQPSNPILNGLTNITGTGLVVYSPISNAFFTRNIQVVSPLFINNSDGINNSPIISLSMGIGSGLNADLLDGLHSTDFLRSNQSGTLTGNLTIIGNSTIQGSISNTGATSGYGNIIIDGRIISSSAALHLSPPNGSSVFINSDYRAAGGSTGGVVNLNVSGAISTFGYSQSTSNRPGPTRLFRSDGDSPYSIQAKWTGSYWQLRGYGTGTLAGIDTYHGECEVGWADDAGAINGVSNISPLGKSYGSIRITGAISGYAGIYFSSIDRTFMSSGSLTGMYQEGVGWDYHISSAVTTSLYLGKSTANTSGLFNIQFQGTNRFQFRGDGYAWSSVHGWTPNWSDINLKRDISSLDSSRCLDIISSLNPIQYRWNALASINQLTGDTPDNSLHYGLIAQELQPIIPSIVKDGPPNVDGVDTFLTYDKTELIPFLIGAIKELKSKLDILLNNL